MSPAFLTDYPALKPGFERVYSENASAFVSGGKTDAN